MNNNQQYINRIDDIIIRLADLKHDLEAQGVQVSISVTSAAPLVDDGDRSLEAFRRMVKQGNYVVLDTETTGLDDGEICQIAVIDSTGNVLLDSLVRTTRPIPMDATRIHGIHDEDVDGFPNWREISAQLIPLLSGRDVIIYNAVYDRKMMHKSAEAVGMPKIDWKTQARFWCAMEAFAEVYGDWNSYRNSYRWKKLTEAAVYYGLPTENAHSALGDCLMTLAVIKRMAGLE
jgi:DNA polymerase-3 subunit epsilon